MKMGGLNDFSRMAKDLRELDGRDEQAAGPALGSGTASRGTKCADRNGGGGTILVPEYGYPQELPPSSADPAHSGGAVGECAQRRAPVLSETDPSHRGLAPS